MNIIQHFAHKLVASYAHLRYKRRFHYVLKCSYTIFSHDQPGWVDAGFDWHFLTHRAAPLIAQLRDSGVEIAAAELANHWADQYTWSPARHAHRVSQATQIANQFLYILMSELRICGLLPEKGHGANHSTEPYPLATF